MGTDITFMVERRDETGAWHRVEASIEKPIGAAMHRLVRESWFDLRHNECFALLAGVPSPRPVEPIEAAISQPRGLPNDASAETVAQHEAWAVFGESWLSARDLITYDWQQPVTNSFMTSPPAEGVNCRFSDEEVRAWVALHGVPPPGWTRAGASRGGVRVVVRTTPAKLAPEFLPVVLRIAALSPNDLDAARCVFWFDR